MPNLCVYPTCLQSRGKGSLTEYGRPLINHTTAKSHPVVDDDLREAAVWSLICSQLSISYIYPNMFQLRDRGEEGVTAGIPAEGHVTLSPSAEYVRLHGHYHRPSHHELVWLLPSLPGPGHLYSKMTTGWPCYAWEEKRCHNRLKCTCARFLADKCP